MAGFSAGFFVGFVPFNLTTINVDPAPPSWLAEEEEEEEGRRFEVEVVVGVIVVVVVVVVMAVFIIFNSAISINSFIVVKASSKLGWKHGGNEQQF